MGSIVPARARSSVRRIESSTLGGAGIAAMHLVVAFRPLRLAQS